MPHNYLALEDTLRNEVKQVLHRGKVDVFVTVQELAPEPPQLVVDDATLGAYCHMLDEVKRNISLQKEYTYQKSFLLTRTGLFKCRRKSMMMRVALCS